jgi:hypothetical protein
MKHESPYLLGCESRPARRCGCCAADGVSAVKVSPDERKQRRSSNGLGHATELIEDSRRLAFRGAFQHPCDANYPRHVSGCFSSLSDGKGPGEKPTAWEGDPPGGHHRRGVLVFKPMNPMPATITLHIRQVGGIADRTFTWNLASP